MRFLVTAGPTREYFDTVRFISNPSSGKMGYAIAAEAAARGYGVTLVSGPVALPEPEGVQVIQVVSAEEMFDAAVSVFTECRVAVMTAAVCDYRPARRLDHKLQKKNRVRPIHLQPTTDICAHLGKIKCDRVVIGFAMEDHDEQAHAESKLMRKHCDAIVLNGLQNVASDAATITVLRADKGWCPPVRGTKIQVAEEIVNLSEDLVESRTDQSTSADKKK